MLWDVISIPGHKRQISAVASDPSLNPVPWHRFEMTRWQYYQQRTPRFRRGPSSGSKRAIHQLQVAVEYRNYSGAGPASVGGEEACGGGVGVDVDIE
jgi:hypothetical protein